MIDCERQRPVPFIFFANYACRGNDYRRMVLRNELYLVLWSKLHCGYNPIAFSREKC